MSSESGPDRTGPGSRRIHFIFILQIGESRVTKKLVRGKMCIYLTDGENEAVRLKKAGKCVIFILTENNRGAFPTGIEYCVEDDWEDEIPDDFLCRVWQRHAGLPWNIVDTKRLSLREMTEEDLDALYEIQGGEESSGFMDHLESDRQVLLCKMKDYIRCMYGFYGFGIWMILLKESGEVIGRAGLQMREGYEEPELGFAIAPAFRGQGFASEACRAVLQYGFDELGLSGIRAVVHCSNRKSLHVCEKLGFTVDNEAVFKDGLWIGLKTDRDVL